MNLKNFNEEGGMEKLHHKFFNLWWSFLCLKKTGTNQHLSPMNNIPIDMSVNVYVSDWLVAKQSNNIKSSALKSVNLSQENKSLVQVLVTELCLKRIDLERSLQYYFTAKKVSAIQIKNEIAISTAKKINPLKTEVEPEVLL